MFKTAQNGTRQASQASGAPRAFSRSGKIPGKWGSVLARLQSSCGNQGVLKLLSGGTLQRKLTINQPGDAHEQEADRVADTVTRTSDPAVTQPPGSQAGSAGLLQRCSCGKSASTGGHCEQCKAMQKRRENPAGSSVTASSRAAAPSIVHDVLSSPGRPLDSAPRSFMEPRFGHDFSGVRIHTDQRAAESAQAVDALAYTAGRDIVFGAGQYAPHTHAGSRLLAHELTHVMQQSPNGGLVQGEIQRKEKDPAERRDLAFVLSKDVLADANALAPGAQQVFANSTVTLAVELKKVNFPIRTLFIVGHGSPTGALTFGSTDPFMGKSQEPEDVASAVRGRIRPEYSPETVDFRACNIGKNAKALEEYRVAFGAKEAIGASCFLSVYEQPLAIGGKEIRQRSDVTPKNRKAFEQELKNLPEVLPEDYRPCIVDTSENAFFKAGGKMIAAAYIDRGRKICLPKMQTETVDPKAAEAITGCKLIRVAERQEPGKLPKEE
jgi:hypothetical protein